jgi:uncharacterized protein (TIGR03437 family)
VGTYAAGSWTYAAVFDGTNIWVSDQLDNAVTKLVAATGALVGTYPVGTSPGAMVFDGINMWVANYGDNTVTKIGAATQPPPSILRAGVVPLYSTSNTVQPGEWVSIYGTALAAGTTIWTGNFPTSLGGTSVKIDGKAAYLSLASPGQINLQVPDDMTTGTVSVVVTTAGGSATSSVTLSQFAPSLLLFDTKHVAGIILRPNGSGAYDGGAYDVLGPTGNSLGYPTVAAKAGDSVVVFGIGFGPTSPAVPAGQAFSGAAATTNPCEY